METGDDIVVEVVDEIGTVRLNRPDRGNSVTPDVVTRMGDAVAGLAETDGVGAVILTGTGKVFCAGADVKDMYAVYSADGADGLMNYLAVTWMPSVQRTVRLLWNAPIPVIAAYNGHATAGGLDFGLSCDVRLTASKARFAESYVNLGMVPVAGGAYLLTKLIGLEKASRMIASGEFIDADQALALGMVSEVCAAEDLSGRAAEVARAMTHGPAVTYANAKRIARAASTIELEVALEESLAANIALIARPEVRSLVVDVMETYSVAH
ncbi:enoyl-CoA hydratase/isomerase family protein [Rhodococcus sp. 06-156-3C]|nr:enoyl-CoA hydratase/isomerase family protein [Rhodococcus sp. 06-156-4C]OZD15712.1 enoyl-CoA hydratase/isomerase family protein [Rhodococcus sp. 06-156-4a]OZD23959.1 enoyl-CoA hydratase/isomerase family protein [Rhodococcus sp. 06-156-3C]OZD27314.1 enoyl-CoA hydratase/isomerase family protein [Rhodococcus sp. 06-156-3b]OZD31657.1 enoyl-CoA hydratase/isomerase family protein [Rhodococcus sp. 06-156-3]OZF65661.1 enoyl-CoA hydratase/isomerase family protein [Rhodococcus sp. 06-156-4]